MGTRNLTMVYIDGEYKVAQYGQWDGNPEVTGFHILQFLRTANLEVFKENVRKCWYGTKEQIHAVYAGFSNADGWMTFEQSEAFAASPYAYLSRDTGYAILNIIEKSPDGLMLFDDLTFAGDSLFCEWAYVLDFDNNTFEVYKGFNETPLGAWDRFWMFNDSSKSWQPIKICANFSMTQLPSDEDFVKISNPPEEEIEETSDSSPNSLDDTIKKIQKSLNNIKNYQSGGNGSWILESYINDIQNAINDYNNQDLKHLEPDPFNILT